MLWEGRGTFRGSLLSYIRVGKTEVPAELDYEWEGAKGSPDAHIRFAIRRGRPECVEIRITARPKGRGITQSDLNSVNLDTAVQHAFANFAVEEIDGRATLLDPEADPIAEDRKRWRALKELQEARATGSSVSREELELVAATYRQYIADRPTQAVATVLDYTTRTAARRVEQARAAGLLPPTSPGKKKA